MPNDAISVMILQENLKSQAGQYKIRAIADAAINKRNFRFLQEVGRSPLKMIASDKVKTDRRSVSRFVWQAPL